MVAELPQSHSWSLCSKDESAYMAGPLTVRGVAVVVVGYTVAPKGKAGGPAGVGADGLCGEQAPHSTCPERLPQGPWTRWWSRRPGASPSCRRGFRAMSGCRRGVLWLMLLGRWGGHWVQPFSPFVQPSCPLACGAEDKQGRSLCSGPPRGIYLCGHSAGAHLAAMMLLVNWTERGVMPNLKGFCGAGRAASSPLPHRAWGGGRSALAADQGALTLNRTC